MTLSTKSNLALGLSTFLTLFFVCSAFAQPTLSRTLSAQSEITLLTASPGDELYSVFGHSALRVVDPENNIDLVFNYGTFDFNTPNFYVKFARGKLLYKLSVAPMEYFLAEYKFDGRAIYEQLLNLNLRERQAVYDFLLINQLPENAYYQYDFFYDNCATRIRDLIDEIVEPIWFDYPGVLPEAMEKLRSLLDYQFHYQPDFHTHRTLRQMLQPLLTEMPWSTFGIDLALGLPADKVATPWDFMYLPDEMLIAFALASLPDGSPLVAEHRVLLAKTVVPSPAGFITPNMVFWFVFLLALLSFVSKTTSRVFDKTFFTVLGITGVVVLILWFFTDHITTKGNLNLLWAIPTHLYFIWVAGYGVPRLSVRFYFRAVAALSVLMLVAWNWIPQGFNSAFFPVVCTVLVKSLPYAFEIPQLLSFWHREKSPENGVA